MLGIKSPAIWSAYVLCVLSAIGAVVYGVINWNKGEEPLYPEDKKWIEDEKVVEEEL